MNHELKVIKEMRKVLEFRAKLNAKSNIPTIQAKVDSAKEFLEYLDNICGIFNINAAAA